MATKKKLLQAAAGSAGGAEGLNVEQVFSTYLYEGNGSEQTVQNGVNLGQAYGSGSARFGGTDTGEYLQTPVSTDFQLGNGDFTVEFFMNVTSAAGANQEPFSFGDGTGEFDFLVFLTGGNVKVYMSSNGSSWDLINGSNAGSYTIGKWHHVAVTRSSAGVRGFVDGVQGFGVGTSATLNQSANQISIGRGQNDKRFNGYISDFHFIKGTEKYSTNFTPPTSALTAQANTKLLTLQQDTLLTDNSTTGHTITEYGGSIYDEPVFGPFDAADAGEGGLVWVKARDTATMGHVLTDTERGAGKAVFSNNTNAQDTNHEYGYLSNFNSNGFTVTQGITNANRVNSSSFDYASWTFRKAPKFFDVVTWTGTGSPRTISHNLGTTVGCMLVKRTSGTTNWRVYHRSNTSQPETDYLMLDSTFSTQDSNTVWNDTAPTDTEFTVGTSSTTNGNGETYVAYLFAHNDGDGEFGPTGDQDIIKCGSYTGTGVSGGGHLVELGFEPQWVMVKRTDASSDWVMLDNMRSLRGYFDANTSDAEDTGASTNYIEYRPTGFKVTRNFIDNNGGNYIYIAIRRGPMAVPTDATDVFAIDTGDNSSGPEFTSGFPVDFAITKNKSTSSNFNASARLTGATFLKTNAVDAESAGSSHKFDYQDGYLDNTLGSDNIAWMWKRAPSYFDVVAYTGNGTAGHTVSHNLGVAPEMMWVKNRDGITDWQVYHSGVGTSGGEEGRMALNDTSAVAYSNTRFYAAPTSSVFSLGSNSRVNTSNDNYIAYLFASVAGVSKVGSYTGSNSDQDIDCGFTSGARFVLIKRYSSTGSWYVFDTERGIVVGADGTLTLDSNGAESSEDKVYAYSGGFGVKGNLGQTNQSGSDYVFYAIA